MTVLFSFKKLLCQLSLLSQFCQLKNIFDFNDQTTGSLIHHWFRVLRFKFLFSGLILFPTTGRWEVE